MSLTRLILASLRHHARMHAAVALGVAVAAAVLCGALVVGDSMRLSLRQLTLDRLGKVDAALAAPRFFREALAAEAQARAAPSGVSFVPAILLDTSIERPDPQPSRRANRVNLIAAADLRRLFANAPLRPLGPREIALNRPLADQLGAARGTEVILRLPKQHGIPADSALGRKDDTVTSFRLTVAEILEPEGLGRFSLRPSQLTPRNAYVSLAALQDWLEQPGQVNAILATDDDVATWPDIETLQHALRPSLADFGLKLEKSPRGYFQITSDQMILSPAVERQLLDSLSGLQVQPALTYLANTIANGERQTPYSTITAIDFARDPPLGPMLAEDGRPLPPLADDQIALNAWTADDLGAKVGDTIRVSYFAPESLDGEVRELSAEFTLAAIVQFSGAAADRGLTPVVAGMTDQLTMDEWDPPFPFDNRRIRPRDEDYWRDHGPTPKAFVSLAAGRKLWASRFGQTTALRIAPAEGLSLDALVARLTIDPAAMGFVFEPVKQQGLAASVGTTPFEALFLGFSFFIIAAAVMLVALLFRLGVERCAAELGTLAAVGFPRRRVARLLAGEGLVVAVLGSLLGLPAGVGYAWLMLLGLRTWWLPAIGAPIVQLHATARSLELGFLCGVAAALLAILWALWRMRTIAPRRLLAGETEPDDPGRRRGRWLVPASAAALALSIAVGVASPWMSEEARAGAFFGAGALVLAACLALATAMLRRGATGAAVAPGRGNLLRLALRNAARRPGRSTLSMGLIAAAVFLIVAVSAFHIDPGQIAVKRTSGNGGFLLVGQSDRPIYQNLNTSVGRAEAGIALPAPLAEDLEVCSLRVRAGEDASCLNLYQPRQPRVLGVSASMIARGGFAWAAAPSDVANPWTLLNAPVKRDVDGVPLAPVILEKNTANYSLHLWQGVGQRFEIGDGRGGTIRLEIVALLDNSIFQGDLLIGETAFRELFPQVSGYRFFLIDGPAEHCDELLSALENALGDYGFATQTTTARMAAFLAVQNTYLSTFQSLGGLGLLLGTIGLAAVQLRNVFERRGELALMRAAGFRRRRLAWMVMLENGLLLMAGLLVGLAAAAVATLPHMFDRAAVPWPSLAITLGLVLAVGFLAGAMAARAVLRLPLLEALRREM